MVRFIMAFQLIFFFMIGTQVVQRERECARVEGISAVLISMPIQALTEVRI